MEIDALKCRKCGSTLFPERAIHLQNEILMVHYVCTTCWRQWYEVDTGRRLVLLEAHTRAATTVPLETATRAQEIDDDSEGPDLAITAYPKEHRSSCLHPRLVLNSHSQRHLTAEYICEQCAHLVKIPSHKQIPPASHSPHTTQLPEQDKPVAGQRLA